MSDIITVQKQTSSKSGKGLLTPSKPSKKSIQVAKHVTPEKRNIPFEKDESPPTKIRKSQRLILNNKNLKPLRFENPSEETEVKSKEEIFEIQSSYSCILCNITLNNIESFLEHVKNIHLVKRTKISKKITRTETDALVCPDCNECFFKMKHTGIVLLDVSILSIICKTIYIMT